MPTPVVVLLVLAVLVAALGAVLVVRYSNWPPAAWARRVRGHVAGLQARRAVLLAGVSDPAAEAARLRALHLDRHLRAVPLAKLTGYPGVGPATADRIRAAGFVTVNDIWLGRFEAIPGIGAVRANDLRNAVAQLKRDETARFDAGLCDEAVTCRAAVDAVEAEAATKRAAVGPEADAVEAALRACEPVVAVADRVTFVAHLTGAAVPGLTTELMDRPLPTPETVAVAPPPPRPATVSPAELNYLRAVAGFGLAVAKTDGRIAEAERGAVRTFLADRFGTDTVLARHLDPALEWAERDVPELQTAAAAVKRMAPAADLPRLVELAQRVAHVSGGTSEAERAAVETAAGLLGVTAAPPPPAADELFPTVPLPPPSVPTRKRPVPPPPPAADHRAALGIPADAELTADLIRRRYNLTVAPLDPEKAAALGPEFARMAEQKRTAARAAADALLAPLGAPFDPPPPPPPPTDLRHNPALDDVFGA